MEYTATFRRYEIKYILSMEQAALLESVMSPYTEKDKFFHSSICSLYFDTPDYLLIRRSLEKPQYKEKLRLRSYGVADQSGEVFAELKKKFKGVVYKRRIKMRQTAAMDALCLRAPFPDTQVGREIAFCYKRYNDLRPRVFISYERDAYRGKEDKDFRMTFDDNIFWRDTDLSLTSGIYGSPLLGGKVLLEVKTTTALPLWLTRFLSENKIYKASFSKYGNAYAAILQNAAKGGVQIA